MINETIAARGHPNIRSTHRNTIEFTKETHITPRGDCIVAVTADKAMLELSEDFKRRLKTGDARLEITIECDGIKDTVVAYGHPNLILTHPTDLVVRKSDFICERTLAIKADKAACDLDRSLVAELAKGSGVSIEIRVT